MADFQPDKYGLIPPRKEAESPATVQSVGEEPRQEFDPNRYGIAPLDKSGNIPAPASQPAPIPATPTATLTPQEAVQPPLAQVPIPQTEGTVTRGGELEIKVPGINAPAVAPQPSLWDETTTIAEGIASGYIDFGSFLSQYMNPMDIITQGRRLVNPELAKTEKLTGEIAREQSGVRRAEEFPEELRPYAYAGEVIGASAPIGGLPLGIAAVGSRMGLNLGNRFIDKIVRTAKEQPKLFTALEAQATGGAAIAGGLAEAVAPGEMGVRVPAEIIGGFWNFPRLATIAGHTGVAGVRRFSSAWSEGARENRLAAELQQIVRDAGDDPQAVAKAIRDNYVPGMKRTAAQLSGDPALTAIENYTRKHYAKFDAKAAEAAAEDLKTLRGSVEALTRTGDPLALKQAAELRRNYYDTVIQGVITSSHERAIEVARRLAPETLEGRSNLARQVYDIEKEALQTVRKVQQSLYSKVNMNIAVQPSKFMQKFTELVIERGAIEALPDEAISRFKIVTDILKSGRQLTLRDFIPMRSKLIELSRKAIKDEEFPEARIYGKLAMGIERDIGQIPGLEEANAFTRSLYDNFSRSFTGDILGKNAQGGLTIPPELVLRRATSGADEAVTMRLKALRESLEFAANDSAAAKNAIAEMTAIQEDFIKIMLQEIADPTTGELSFKQLARFKATHKELLELFPGLKKDLDLASRTREFWEEAVKYQGSEFKKFMQKDAFMQLAGDKSENLLRLVDNMITGTAPQAAMKEIAAAAKRAGPDAVAGLRRIVIEQAFEKAINVADPDLFSFKKFRAMLFEPRRPGQPSTMDMLKSGGVVDDAYVSRVSKLLKEAQTIENVINSRRNIDNILNDERAWVDFVLRLSGTHLVAPFTPKGPGSIMASYAGARFMREKFDKLPRKMTRELLPEVLENPLLAAAMLERPVTKVDKMRLAQQIHAYFYASGILASQEGRGN